MRRHKLWSVACVIAVGCACRQAPEQAVEKTAPTSSTAPPAVSTTDDAPVLADDCPQPAPPVNGEIAAQASATVPLKTGLTLATSWHRTTEDDDVECLTQIHGIDGTMIAASANCSMTTGTQRGWRRTCRTDLRAAYMYYTGAGDEKAVLRGTTMFSLSTQAFGELKAKGRTRHRVVSVNDGAIIADLDGALERQATHTLSTIVNDRVVELPVVRASGKLQGMAMGKPVQTRVVAAIVDDDRFPLVLDYSMPDVGAAGFSVRYTKISFPTDGHIEQQLAGEQRIDVYGIYFDINSDRLRSESDPVMREIAAALRNNPSWQLAIDGHTDSTGGPEANMQLSSKRADAVRAALVTQHGIDGSRLATRGYGATVPKDTNDTADGRARNRRVELVRR
jgi:outer membrane protein OmpA-like peptidoglycan-associated protein